MPSPAKSSSPQTQSSGIKPSLLKPDNTVASRRASARRRGSFQPKDLGWLDSCDKHRNEGEM
ncbi:hypothetical protein CFBP6626_22085 [Agrobacterium tumefaciens]|nr:hypothetical protein CFBP6626_22085 [Agrobacterium tumefaciens]